VVSSSGHGILDRAAIDSLQQVKYLPAAVAILNGKDLEVILPVNFKLL
jgi:TonB family protein